MDVFILFIQFFLNLVISHILSSKINLNLYKFNLNIALCTLIALNFF